jgi:hypothetical protein
METNAQLRQFLAGLAGQIADFVKAIFLRGPLREKHPGEPRRRGNGDRAGQMRRGSRDRVL